MNHFPSEWFHFTDHKEIRRLRQAVSETTSFKVEITVAVLLAIASAFFDTYLSEWSICVKILVFLIIGVSVIYLFNRQAVKQLFSDSIMLGVKQAVTIFDEEVVYDIMVAAEYCNHLDTLNTKTKEDTLNTKTKDDQLAIHLASFYCLEIKYYIQEAQMKLSRMRAEASIIFGDQHSQISLERVENAIALIGVIKEKSGVHVGYPNDEFDQFVKDISDIRSK